MLLNGVEKIAFFIYVVIGSLFSGLWSSPSVLGYFLAVKEHARGPTEVSLSPEDTRC